MKIINNPNPQVEVIRRVCPKCQCEFEYYSTERKSKSNGILGPGHHTAVWINCPNCGKTIYEN